MINHRIALVLMALSACNGESDPNAPTVHFSTHGGVTPQPLEIPFPSDIYRADSDGTIVDTLSDWSRIGVGSQGDALRNGYSILDGFGRTAGSLFLIDGGDGIDAESLASDDSVIFVELPRDGASLRPVRHAARWIAGQHVVSVVPEEILRSGATYVVALTRAVRDRARRALQPASEFRQLRDTGAADRVGPVSTMYGAALDRLASGGYDRARIVGMSVFTTETYHQRLRAIRDGMNSGTYGAAPQFNLDATRADRYTVARFGAAAHVGWTATLDEWMANPPVDGNGVALPGVDRGDTTAVPIAHDAIGAVLNGTFTVPEFRRAFAGTSDAADGTIAFDPQGAAIAANTAGVVPLTIVLPRALPPADGYPVIVFGHGTPGSRLDGLATANEFARAGFALLIIDGPSHGLEIAAARDETSVFGGTYRGPDGLPDLFSDRREFARYRGDFLNTGSWIHSAWQMVIELDQAVRLARNPALDLHWVAEQYGGVAPRLDGTRIGFFGVSMGGQTGTTLAAIEANVGPVVLDCPPAGGVRLWADVPAYPQVMYYELQSIYGLPEVDVMPLDRFNPFLVALNGAIDPSDTAAFAFEAVQPSATGAPRDMYILEVLNDENVSNRASEMLAAAMGVQLVQPRVRAIDILGDAVPSPLVASAGAHVRGLAVQSIATHGGNYAVRHGFHAVVPPFPLDADPFVRFNAVAPPVRIRNPVPMSLRSITRFFTSAFTGGATIDTTDFDTVVDFDDDGWSDDEETAAGTNPLDPTSHPTGTAPHVRPLPY